MESVLVSPANYNLFGFLPLFLVALLLTVGGITAFIYIAVRRLAPLLRANPDPRFDRIPERIFGFLRIWLLQWRHPRYIRAGVIHILLFAGFLVLGAQTISMMFWGISENFSLPFMSGPLGHVYNIIKNYAGTWVLIVVVIAAYRRAISKPERYLVPPKYGKDHTSEAILVLGFIATLMITENLFDASLIAANMQKGLHAEFRPPLTLVWFFTPLLKSASLSFLQGLHLVAYYIHDIIFFVFVCFLPFGKHFHVVTAIPNVFFKRLDTGTVKPVKHGVTDEQLDDLESFGVKKFEDFTWKHMLDFYTCVDCGRCSDNCPANAVGRPLSPRFISIKGRDYAFKHYPLNGKLVEGEPLIGSIYDEDEIWSCTTCGACEQECPVTIEYINKIVDLRRGMVDEGMVPQSLQKPLSALEKRGNPWGKMERKRADWAKDKEFAAETSVKLFEKKESADVLYFVDSISSFDDRMQEVAQSTARVLAAAGEDFGILGKTEKDSGHEARRFGEEMLFMDLRDQNSDAIAAFDPKKIVTSDPHAYNALKNDYTDMPPVEHISQTILQKVKSGQLKLKPVEDAAKVYTYHDPCYLGRHNKIYDEPREALDSIPGLRRVEMARYRDRSFCCGGGGLMLFYEPEEEQRMGVLRVQMADEAGANVIVTACPFCLVNMEDAIKVAGLDGKMEAIDLAELIDRHTAD
jgi:Fe-S oxidoreductase